MTNNYNTQIAKLGAMFNAVASEITNDETLKLGEKFLLLQRMFLELKPLEKNFKATEKEIKEVAINTLHDTGNGKSEAMEYEGAEIIVKYSYPKPSLDSELLKKELERAYADLNVEYNENNFIKESTPRKTVVIQSLVK